MWDILSFRRMITPSLLQWLFWLCICGFLINAIISLTQHHPFTALFWLLIAPLALRITIELLMCFFAIQNQLNDIRKSLIESNPPSVSE